MEQDFSVTLTTTQLAKLVIQKAKAEDYPRYPHVRVALRSFNGSLDPRSVGQYCSNLKRVLRYKVPATLKGIALMIELSKDTELVTKFQIEAALSAVKRLYTALGIGYDEREAKQVMAMRDNHLEANAAKFFPKRKCRGSMEYKQFVQLINRLREEKIGTKDGDVTMDYDEVEKGIIFQYAFAFRGKQVAPAQRKHFRRDYDSQLWHYMGPRDKSARKPGEPVEMETHEILTKLNPLISQMLEGLESEDYVIAPKTLFAVYPMYKVGQLIKRTAEEHGWPGDKEGFLTWVSHSLRHGSITEQVKTEGVAKALRGSAHRTEAMVTDVYGVTNDARIDTVKDRRKGKRAKGKGGAARGRRGQRKRRR